MTTLGQLALLLSLPIRIVGFIAVETGKSLAVAVGTAWVGPDGKFRWRR